MEDILLCEFCGGIMVFQTDSKIYTCSTPWCENQKSVDELDPVYRRILFKIKQVHVVGHNIEKYKGDYTIYANEYIKCEICHEFI